MILGNTAGAISAPLGIFSRGKIDKFTKFI